ALIERPKRLVYLSSGMHQHADANLDDILWRKRRWNGSTAYAESKLHDAMLAFGVARRWPDVLSNAVTELACRHHHDLDLVIGRREFGFNGRARWRIARRYPGIPDRIHLREIRHVRDPNIGRE